MKLIEHPSPHPSPTRHRLLFTPRFTPGDAREDSQNGWLAMHRRTKTRVGTSVDRPRQYRLLGVEIIYYGRAKYHMTSDLRLRFSMFADTVCITK